MRYAIKFQYNGAAFSGWQNQGELRTVQSCLEKALSELFQTPTSATASGRTDAGVHAKGQVAHFDTQTSIPVEKIPYALNTLLPSDISALECKIVPDDFNARFSAKRKTYVYKIYSASHRRPTLDNDRAHIIFPLDADEMKRAALQIEGEHDFSAFMATGSPVKSTIRTVYGIEILESEEDDAKLIDIKVTGNGFLYNMVRIIAGTLVYVGIGKIKSEEINTIISNKDRTAAGKTLPPHGLTLLSVEY